MISQNIKKIASITGLFLGAFALSAIAADWTPATQVAPAGNTGAPINVTSSPQYKEGPLAVGKNGLPTTGYDLEVDGVAFLSGLKIGGNLEVVGNAQVDSIRIGETAVEENYVLTKIDAYGNAAWRAPSSLGIPLSVSAVDSFEILIPRNGTNTITTPTPYLFCAITKMQNFANSDYDNSTCYITKQSNGTWKLDGQRADDPAFICGMTCFK